MAPSPTRPPTRAHPICAAYSRDYRRAVFPIRGRVVRPARRRGERIKRGIVPYTALMFSIVTIFYALSVNIQSLSFIDNRGFPGVEGMPFVGPVGYRSFLESKAPGLAINLMWCLNSWLADGLLASPSFDVAFIRLGV